MKDFTLKSFFASYPHINLATEADNQDILDFYHQQSLTSKESDIIYERGNNFFSFLKERSENSLVLLMRNDSGFIQGMGVLSYRPGFIDGRAVTVGYLGDLRVKLNRKLIREWRSMYANLMRLSPSMKETFYCSHYQTVLIDDNGESRNNLAETKIDNLYYQRLAGYKMVNIIARINLFKTEYHIRWATSSDKKLISTFLQTIFKRSLFAHDWSLEFDRRLEAWNNFSIQDHILVFDSQGNLNAVTSIWNPVKTKQIKLTSIPKGMKLLHKFLKILPLIDAKKLPEENSVIDIMYVNQINFEDSLNFESRRKIAQEIMHFSFEKKFNMLAYADFENENFLGDCKTLIMQKMSMALFSVHYKEDEGNVIAPLSWVGEDSTPTFDMSLV